MALVQYGAGIIQMSGSIAGDVHARNRYGNYIRPRTKPINPNSARQQNIRAVLAALTERWSDTLTAVQRAAWNLYGAGVVMKNRLNADIHLTGFNHYIRSNAVIVLGAGTPYDDGPVIFQVPGHDPDFAITASEATQLITYTYDATLDWANETGGFLWYSQGQPQNAQRNFFGGPWQWGGGLVGVTGAPPASPLIRGVSFAIAEGQHQWVFARIQRADGRISTPFRADVLVAA